MLTNLYKPSTYIYDFMLSYGLSPTFMADTLNELDIQNHNESSCQSEVHFDGNIKDFTKKTTSVTR